MSNVIRYPSLRRLAYRISPTLFVRRLELKNLLIGGGPYSSLTHARLSGEMLRPSTPIAASPHVQFLETYREIGDSIFEAERFAATPYCQYALKCIELYGRYFSHTDLEGVLHSAKSFARMFDGKPAPLHTDRHRSRPGAPIKVMRVRLSNCYEVIDGHHRLAVAAVRGAEDYPCAILPTEGTLTPLQLLVMDSVWVCGRCQLLQPISAPELQGWRVARQCADRLDLIMAWLKRNGISSGSFLDVGSSYGWFVAEMAKRGFEASGVEQDAALAAVGPLAYGIEKRMITVANLAKCLKSTEKKYDVVCCLSILHDYIQRGRETSAAEFIRLVDGSTGSVLFFDTGERHENHFKQALRGWNVEFIQNWLRDNTSFTNIEILGTDRDGRGAFPKRYGRHLFACSRSGAAMRA
ncbi:MAG: ParB N-terminal domain-containing protein [Methylocystis sp.]|nr:ParB N-terminal domain-containing protein [Methylocystis sp.]